MKRSVFLLALFLLVFQFQSLLALDIPLGNKGLYMGVVNPVGFNAILEMQYYQGVAKDGSGQTLKSPRGKTWESDFVTDFVLEWNTPAKFLGANYSFDIVIPFVSVDVNQGSSNFVNFSGLADIYIDPVILGWSTKYVDVKFNLGINLPLGNDGLTKDHFSFAASVPLTLFFNEARTVSLTIMPIYEYHLKNGRSAFNEGADFAIKWGIGYKFLGANDIGIIGYSNIQTTTDFGKAPEGKGFFGAGEQEVHAIGIQYNRYLETFNSIIQILINQEFYAENMPRGTRVHVVFVKLF